MGGMGGWSLLEKQKFAGFICIAGSRGRGWRVKNQTPVLFLHGKDDEVVPTGPTLGMHRWLLSAGRKSKFVVVEDTGHDILFSAMPRIMAEVKIWLEGVE
jgi:predicted peptidase